MSEIRFITAKDCLDLRSRVLRPNQPIELCHYPEDYHNDSFHLGFFLSEKIIGHGTFLPQQHVDFKNSVKSYRLRGMAVDPRFQNQNIGSKILAYSLIVLKDKNADFLWFNARESAFHFYEKNGFSYHGNLFEIPMIGPHKVMYKWL